MKRMWERRRACRYLRQREQKTKLQMEYGKAYRDMVADVRRRQHDFKNQLAVIYSMHVTANTLEELVQRQRAYGDILLRRIQYDNILTDCENPVLAAYLYGRCTALEKEGISVEHNISVERGTCRMPLHEVIELLGIFMDNAAECVRNAKEGSRSIKLELVETDDRLIVSASNPSPYMKCSEINRLFRNGYSTKGKGHGIGLARAKQLAHDLGMDIIVKNSHARNQNWITFQMRIPKP